MIRNWRNSGIRLERNVVLIMLKPFFTTLLDVYFRQLDNEYENDRQGQITSREREEFAAEIQYKTNIIR